MAEPFRQIIIDNDHESYRDFLPETWTIQIDRQLNQGSLLEGLIMNLFLAWRSTSYTAALPLILTESVRSGIEGAEGEQSGLNALEYWKRFLDLSPFRLSIWSTQRIAFVAFVNSYEAFLIALVKSLTGEKSVRSQKPIFAETLQKGFVENLYESSWNSRKFRVAREIRHCLSHADGEMTDKLKGMQHDVEMTKDNRIHIQPKDNKRLMRVLQSGVESIIRVANNHPILSQPK